MEQYDTVGRSAVHNRKLFIMEVEYDIGRSSRIGIALYGVIHVLFFHGICKKEFSPNQKHYHM